MQFSFISFIFIIATFLGILIFFALFFKNATQKHSSRLLASYILVFSLFAAHNFLVVTGLLTQLPYAFRCTKALHYLPSVFLYLYVRATVKHEQSLQKKDYLLFLPTVLHFAELLPFYFTDKVTKKQQVAMFFKDMNSSLKNYGGFFSGYVHPILVFILSAACILYSYQLIARTKKSLINKNGTIDILMYKWLNLFLSFNVLLFCTLGFHICTAKFLNNYNVFLTNLIETSCLLIAIGITLFFHPNILYGIPLTYNTIQNTESVEQKDETAGKLDSKSLVIATEKKEQYLKIIELKMNELKPFLQEGFSLKDLSDITNIPYTYLSTIINQEYNLNFNELVNKYRIDYVKAILEMPESNLYTLEAISKKAGFSSRATFSRAFSKFEGCSPKDYLKKSHSKDA
ncbi:MAG: AraC family transcriptional regulator [Flavobacterium sp.]|nr:AraC family transcriptional regulator [Flavobacterium sp.]